MPLVVLNPTPDAPPVPARIAPPLVSLEGRTVGLLDNGKFNVAPFLDCVEALLRDEYGVRDIVRRRKANQNAPAPAALLAELAGCDAVILAQFSMARAKASVADDTGRPVFTTPDSAVMKLKRLLGANHREV